MFHGLVSFSPRGFLLPESATAISLLRWPSHFPFRLLGLVLNFAMSASKPASVKRWKRCPKTKGCTISLSTNVLSDLMDMFRNAESCLLSSNAFGSTDARLVARGGDLVKLLIRIAYTRRHPGKAKHFAYLYCV
jgi:hypothetical protein